MSPRRSPITRIFPAAATFASLSVIAAVVGGPVSATAARADTTPTLYVASTGSDSNDCLTADAPCLTIQHAISLATDDYTIVSVGPGTYPESLIISAGSNVDIEGAKDSTSIYANDLTTIAPTAGRAVTQTGGSLGLDAVNLTGAEDSEPPAVGGVIDISNGSSYFAGDHIMDGTATSDSNDAYGGDVAVSGGNVTFEGDDITDGTATSTVSTAAGGNIALLGGTAVIDRGYFGGGVTDSPTLSEGGSVYVSSAFSPDYVLPFFVDTIYGGEARTEDGGTAAGGNIADSKGEEFQGMTVDGGVPDNISAVVGTQLIGDLVFDGNCDGSASFAGTVADDSSCGDIVGSRAATYAAAPAVNRGFASSQTISPDSPAFRAVSAADCYSIDEGGYSRSYETSTYDSCDAGAYELLTKDSTTTLVTDAPMPFGKAVTMTATVSSYAGQVTDGVMKFADDSGQTLPGCGAVPVVAATSGPDAVASCVATALPVGDNPITATYSNGELYQPSSDTNNFNVTAVAPTITAHLTSQRPTSKYGWYRTSVSVGFTCTDGGVALTQPCPVGTVVIRNGRSIKVTKTITNTAGLSATVTKIISIDETAPKVRVAGLFHDHLKKGDNLKVVATDPLSGVAKKKLTLHKSGKTEHYTATATDKAGNTTTVKGAYCR